MIQRRTCSFCRDALSNSNSRSNEQLVVRHKESTVNARSKKWHLSPILHLNCLKALYGVYQEGVHALCIDVATSNSYSFFGKINNVVLYILVENLHNAINVCYLLRIHFRILDYKYNNKTQTKVVQLCDFWTTCIVTQYS